MGSAARGGDDLGAAAESTSGAPLRPIGPQRLGASDSPSDPYPVGTGGLDSERIARARLRARERYERQGSRLQPISWLLLVVVLLCAWTGEVRPGLSGVALGMSLALACYTVPLALAAVDRWPERTLGWRIALVVLISASGLTLSALEPTGALADIPVSAAVMMGFFWLDLRRAVMISGTTTVLLGVLLALTASRPLETAIASMLLCVVLAVTAELIRRSRESQDRTELLLAQLEDAREAETRAAAGAERARIARELHDVLAQSLSALSIQLEGARRLAERDQVAPLLQQIIERSVELTREGLNEARQAVGALRGDRLPDLADLAPLVERSRRDLELTVALAVHGTPRPCEPQAGFALYRGVQEALTNVARYARGARADVILDYRPQSVVVTVANSAGSVPSGPSAGGGNGLRGMRERIERVGGTAHAGPQGGGWQVAMEVPA
ncbi:hypothetical protein GCM10009665_11970 [Kitasatospora nipponensis]|uniref:histidine kinase n=1 Tax=Kitasatospora nipponensis TaxID=258049 RepID=A0ABP4GKG1_9ACTN